MYNRYVPQSDGSFSRQRMQEPQKPQKSQPASCSPAPPAPPPPPSCPPEPPRPRPMPPKRHGETPPAPAGSFLKQLFPKIDTEDLMIVLLLLLMAGDCREDQNFALLTLALYLFL